MAIDVLKVLRLRSTVVAASVGVTSTMALVELYSVTRKQLLAMLAGDDALTTEFEDLFPTWDGRRGGSLSVVVGQGVTQSEGRGRLRGMVGWLDGLIEAAKYTAQIQANAEAYACERVKVERGMGFRAES